MSEMIMALDANLINTYFGEDSNNIIRHDNSQIINFLESNHVFVQRTLAEFNRNFKQVVSYCLITNGNHIFVTQRTTKQTEKRLHNRFSIGVGGHICYNDSKSDSIILAGMKRELFEEVDIQCPFTYDLIGLINDNSSEVNSVHIGLCFLIKLEKKKCIVKETEKMLGFWIDKSEIMNYYNEFEGWSRILSDSVLR